MDAGDQVTQAVSGAIDSYGRRHAPGTTQLLRELKNTAYACAAINAAVMAAAKPRLYLRSASGQAVEVMDHPLLDLIGTANPYMNGHDLLELTTLYQECTGHAYWLLGDELLGRPLTLWPLAPQHVTPHRDHFEYRAGAKTERYPAERVIHFRYPDPSDPYRGGLSPLRGAWEHVTQDSELTAFKFHVWKNRGVPGVVIAPKDVISSAERQRLEEEYTQKFTGGNQGRPLVAEESISIHQPKIDMGDLSALAEQAATKELIANAFGVPIALLTRDTNMANLVAALKQHAVLAIRPRLRRRDEKLNEQLVPRFDPAGRLFFESADPIRSDPEIRRQEEESDLRFGVRTINEVRAARGLQPVEWGDKPFTPLATAARTEDLR